MPEIRLVKKYPHIKDEDVTSIFQEGYIKGFENGRKGAIPIEWIRSQKMESNLNVIDYALGVIDGHNCCIDMLIRRWEKENEK